MKQFKSKELVELKYEVAHLLDSLDSYKNIVKVYYTSLSVLQYFDSLSESNVSQIDLQFWVHANEKALQTAPKVEEDVLPLFKELWEFEGSLLRAQQKYFNSYNFYDWKKYRMLQAEQQRRNGYYRTLRQLAGIYLDILSDNPQDERYKLWRQHYDLLSIVLDEKRRGFDEDDDIRLSVPEMNLLLEENELSAKREKDEARRLHYWQPRIDYLNELIKNRQSE